MPATVRGCTICFGTGSVHGVDCIRCGGSGKVRTKTPHERIIEAAKAGRGVRLTVDEVAELADDDAIRQAAEPQEGPPDA